MFQLAGALIEVREAHGNFSWFFEDVNGILLRSKLISNSEICINPHFQISTYLIICNLSSKHLHSSLRFSILWLLHYFWWYHYRSTKVNFNISFIGNNRWGKFLASVNWLQSLQIKYFQEKRILHQFSQFCKKKKIQSKVLFKNTEKCHFHKGLLLEVNKKQNFSSPSPL